jgi:putative sterol carrier protein
VATVAQCEQALHTLAQRLADNEASRRKAGFDRSVTCTIRDLDVVFAGRLKDGQLLDIGPAAARDAQVRLTMTGDDLLALVDGDLKMASAWATGRVKIEASVRDLMRLRSVF